MIQEIETALLARVKAIMAPHGFAVEALPDNPDSFALANQRGAVLVVNKGSRYEAPKSTDRPIQDRTLTYELTVLVRNLRRHDGAYEVIDALAAGLAGWRPQGAMSGTRLARDGFVNRDAGVWEWNVTVEIPVLLFPTPPKAAEEWAPIESITAKIGEETITTTFPGGAPAGPTPRTPAAGAQALQSGEALLSLHPDAAPAEEEVASGQI